MSRIKIVAASAGTGKTTRLAQILEEQIAAGRVRPEAVLATTFTKKAATELMERGRKHLLKAGRTEDAHRLAAARIGTVNGICDRLVSEFAFELGQPPRLRVLDEVVASEHLNRALASVLTSAVEDELAALKWRMDAFEWPKYVRRIIEAARSNRISLDTLAVHGQRSVQSAVALLGPPRANGAAVDAALKGALEAFINSDPQQTDTTKGTARAVSEVKKALARLRTGHQLAWRQWVKLPTLHVSKASEDKAEPVRQAAAQHDVHPELRADLARGITLVFEVAQRTLNAYQQLKRAWGVIDFVDQEVLALDLLRRKDVQEQLSQEIDLVLVDEFQDTSPLQLAIFLELSKLAAQSIWVGDQKQAIFGFRGTDPALMNAAIEEFLSSPDPALINKTVGALLTAAQPETLNISYRSRPELVRLTSDVFIKAFASHGMPEERVRLEPPTDDEPPGLGPVVEFWPLIIPSNSRTTDADRAVATGVRDLLAGTDERVRDPETRLPRRPRAADIAVLCRTNTQCARVASALEALHIRAVVPRVGLFNTVEGRIALSALCLWVDPFDRLAQAELARAIHYPGDGDAWLQAVICTEGQYPFAETATIKRLATARQQLANAGPLDALDAIIEALELPTLCARWGDTVSRLGNLEALRTHAVHYVEHAKASGEPTTPAGLYAHFLSLGEEGYNKDREDSQAVVGEEQAVAVSTWHRAKGLEWPITILFGLEGEREASAIGVNVASDRDQFDLDDPLGGRWIRLLPTPYHPGNKKMPFYARMQRDPHADALRREARREALRLLYVGWTRARDRLIFASRQNKFQNGILSTLTEIDAGLIDTPMERSTWAGRTFDVTIRAASPTEAPEQSPTPGKVYAAREITQHPPQTTSPSVLPKLVGRTGAVETIGDRLEVGDVDRRLLGNAVHCFLAADDPGDPDQERVALAERQLRVWSVAQALLPSALLTIGDRLAEWTARRFPGARVFREWPLRHRLDTQTVVRGTPDLVLQTQQALIVIDHKSFVGAQEDAVEYVKTFAAQLAAYRAALQSATGRTVTGCFIHLPLCGLMVALDGE